MPSSVSIIWLFPPVSSSPTFSTTRPRTDRITHRIAFPLQCNSSGLQFSPLAWSSFPRCALSSWPTPLLINVLQSPRWLIKSSRDADAAQALSRLTSLPIDDSEVLLELEEIRLNLKHDEEFGSGTYRDCFRASDNRIRFRTLTGIFLLAFQQLSGINFFFFFGTTFFTSVGIRSPYLISIAISTINAGMTIPGIWGVERYGRRPLLLFGAIGTTVCEFVCAIVGSTTSQGNRSAQSAEVAFLCLYIAFFASTWGPVPWVIVGEIFPLKVRAKAMSLSTASIWFWNFWIAYSSESHLSVLADSYSIW